MEHLPSMHSALGSTLSTYKNKYVFPRSTFLVPIPFLGPRHESAYFGNLFSRQQWKRVALVSEQLQQQQQVPECP